MSIAPMCFSVLRVPRCRVYSWVNTWWEGFDSLSRTCKESHHFRLLGPSSCGDGGNSRRWSRRPISTTSEGRSIKVLNSAANIRHGLTDENVTSVSTNLTFTKTGDIKHHQIQCTDVRQLIAKNKDLARLATFIVFDLETTGLSREDERIIEIALQDLQGGENSTFHTLINPGRTVLNSKYHGITTDMVKRPEVPRMDQFIPILLGYVKSRQKPGGFVVFIAHNARVFDVPFLVNEFKRCSTEMPPEWLFLDTLPLARDLMKSLGLKVRGQISLQSLREHYKIQLRGAAHRAMSDVHVLALVLQKMTFDLKRPVDEIVQMAFTANELKSSKKIKDSS